MSKEVALLESLLSFAVTTIPVYPPVVPAVGVIVIFAVPFPLSVKVAKVGKLSTLKVMWSLGSSTAETFTVKV